MGGYGDQRFDGYLLDEEYKTFIKRIQSAEEKIERIYHYTSAAGLCGILLTEDAPKLRFSRADLLNDVSEGVYFDNLLECELDNDNWGTQKDDAFVELVRKVKSHNKSRILRKVTETLNGVEYKDVKIAFEDSCVSDTYLCCFSLENDSLPMWNYYCKNNRYEGYNICFRKGNLSNSLKHGKFGNDCRVEMFEIIYDYNKQKKIISEGLNILYSAYKSNNDENILSYYIVKFIDDFKYRFKPEAFAHEQEYRITFTIERNPANISRHNYPIHYRDINGMIVPYVELDMIKKKDIESVTIGPLLRKDEGEKYQQSLREMLNREGYERIDVRASKVEVRY